MRHVRGWAAVIGIVGGFVIAMPSSWAITEKQSYVDGALRKLGRGIANIATCPGELIRTAEAVRVKDGFLASATVGVVKGLVRTVGRGVVGVFEVATFYVEVPADFKPIMKPEFVFSDEDWVQE